MHDDEECVEGQSHDETNTGEAVGVFAQRQADSADAEDHVGGEESGVAAQVVRRPSEEEAAYDRAGEEHGLGERPLPGIVTYPVQLEWQSLI